MIRPSVIDVLVSWLDQYHDVRTCSSSTILSRPATGMNDAGTRSSDEAAWRGRRSLALSAVGARRMDRSSVTKHSAKSKLRQG